MSAEYLNDMPKISFDIFMPFFLLNLSAPFSEDWFKYSFTKDEFQLLMHTILKRVTFPFAFKQPNIQSPGVMKCNGLLLIYFKWIYLILLILIIWMC